jgi:hypothetical protein
MPKEPLSWGGLPRRTAPATIFRRGTGEEAREPVLALRPFRGVEPAGDHWRCPPRFRPRTRAAALNAGTGKTPPPARPAVSRRRIRGRRGGNCRTDGYPGYPESCAAGGEGRRRAGRPVRGYRAAPAAPENRWPGLLPSLPGTRAARRRHQESEAGAAGTGRAGRRIPGLPASRAPGRRVAASRHPGAQGGAADCKAAGGNGGGVTLPAPCPAGFAAGRKVPCSSLSPAEPARRTPARWCRTGARQEEPA